MTPAPPPPHRPPKRRRHLLPSSAAAATSRTPAPAEGGTADNDMLPCDLIFEILSRVPVRSACRFTCVSKRWGAMISDPTFLAAHKSLHSEPLIIGSSGRNPEGRRDLQLVDMKGNAVRVTKGLGGMAILSSSSDGLVCIVNYYHVGVHVIDPFTGMVLEQNPKEPVGQCLDTRSYGNNSFEFGFGRAVPSGVHKVVRKSDLTCKVFTLGDDTRWRRSQSAPTRTRYAQNHPVVNGVMYFLVTRMVNNYKLLCFDLESEVWIKMIDSPRKVAGHELWKRTGINSLAKLNDALCMVQSETDMNDHNRRTNIWLLTDFDKEIWIKAYTIPMPPYTHYYVPLRIVGDTRKLIFCSYAHEQGYALQVYDPHTGTCTMLRLLDNVVDIIGVCRFHLDRFISTKI